MQKALEKKVHDKSQVVVYQLFMYLNKMSNVLQTHPHMFAHVPKLKFSIRHIPQNWIFLAHVQKPKYVLT